MVTETALLKTEPDDAVMITVVPTAVLTPANVHDETSVQLKVTAVLGVAVQLALTGTLLWPPEVLPVAVRIRLLPLRMEIVPVLGDTEMLVILPLVTVNDTVPWIPLEAVAVIVAVPAATPCTTPEPLTLAVVESELVQVRPEVIVFVLPSL
jgi:hypothetical protein